MNHIELFAGCGGLGLGLESANFRLVMANELSPMAAETFAYNFFGENLRAISAGDSPPETRKQTKWLSSQYAGSDLSNRLKENPHEYPPLDSGETDIATADDLNGSLVIGSIIELNNLLEAQPPYAKKLRESFGRGELDLVSGGPPCQSFSLAGLRQRNNQRNSLPWEMAKFVKLTQPKFALLENVTGILRAFRDNGEEFHAWFEVAKAFTSVDYVPLCLHVNAKFAGVAQNRPRFIMIAVRSDILRQLEPTLNQTEKDLFEPSVKLHQRMSEGIDPSFSDLRYFDAAKQSDFCQFAHSFLSPLIRYQVNIRTVSDAIDDLKLSSSGSKSEYVKEINRVFGPLVQKRKIESKHDLENHEMRKNGDRVKRRFRIYQMLRQLSPADEKIVKKLLKGEIISLPSDVAKKVMKFDFLTESGNFKCFGQQSDLEYHLITHGTKKQTQKALLATQPAPAALSIPDDACHYDHDELRTLSVREMARIQSFPDNFVFRSKVTTGGHMRRYEVPQYTQVGNAVPPLLGRALGLAISDLLRRL